MGFFPADKKQAHRVYIKHVKSLVKADQFD